MFVEIGTPQCLHIQEAKSRRLSLDRARQQLAITKQVGLVLPDVVRTKPVWRTTEVPGELFHCADIAAHRTGRIVAALEFIQHHLTESGHGDLLVTHTLHRHRTTRRPLLQRPPRSGLVQTGIAPRIRASKPFRIPEQKPTYRDRSATDCLASNMSELR
jgi:hypothetical protein